MPSGRMVDLEIGRFTKVELLSKLSELGVLLNDYARTLFASDAFTTSAKVRSVRVVAMTLDGLGLPDGGTYDQIVAAAGASGLTSCPLEAAPYLRMRYLDQPVGPYLTVASERLRLDDGFPNGLYLRRLDDGPWLRGYFATPDVVYEPDFSRFVFMRERQ